MLRHTCPLSGELADPQVHCPSVVFAGQIRIVNTILPGGEVNDDRALAALRRLLAETAERAIRV
jgi:hypothetical protein